MKVHNKLKLIHITDCKHFVIKKHNEQYDMNEMLNIPPNTSGMKQVFFQLYHFVKSAVFCTQ